jgi:hypothetical protein
MHPAVAFWTWRVGQANRAVTFSVHFLLPSLQGFQTSKWAANT